MRHLCGSTNFSIYLWLSVVCALQMPSRLQSQLQYEIFSLIINKSKLWTNKTISIEFVIHTHNMHKYSFSLYFLFYVDFNPSNAIRLLVDAFLIRLLHRPNLSNYMFHKIVLIFFGHNPQSKSARIITKFLVFSNLHTHDEGAHGIWQQHLPTKIYSNVKQVKQTTND